MPKVTIKGHALRPRSKLDAQVEHYRCIVAQHAVPGEPPGALGPISGLRELESLISSKGLCLKRPWVILQYRFWHHRAFLTLARSRHGTCSQWYLFSRVGESVVLLVHRNFRTVACLEGRKGGVYLSER